VAIFAGKFERVVFIISSGRTGTKALAHHLSACYDNVYAVHEPRPSWRLRRASARWLSGRISRHQLVRLLADSRSQLLARVRQPVYIESNPFLGGFLEAIAEVFEKPRIVHVVRDPRTYIRSSINWGCFRGIRHLASTYLPYWLPKPEQIDPNCPKPWNEMPHAERLAWYWKTLNAELNRGQNIFGNNYLRVRFEDLFARDGSGLQSLVQWIGLPWKPQLPTAANSENVNASKARICPPWRDWTEPQQQQVLHHCRDLMGLYGYDPAMDLAAPAASAPAAIPSLSSR